MDPSASIATLIDRKVYYFLTPLLPGGVLVMSVLVGKQNLWGLLLYSEGLGYIFRISLLLAAGWVIGGITFLVCWMVVEAGIGVASGIAENIGQRSPWKITLWRKVLTTTFGTGLVPGGADDGEWKEMFEAMEKALPDPALENAEMMCTLVLSSAAAVCLGTIWWHAARMPILYIGVFVVLALTGFVIYVYGADFSENLAARQIGILLKQKLDADAKKNVPAAS